MKWLKKLFSVEEIDFAPSDLSIRVAEIQQRIAILKRSIEQSEKSYKNSSTQTKSMVDTKPQQSSNDAQATKTAEMMALKSKLLGKKS